MNERHKDPRESIASFFSAVRADSGLQGQLNAVLVALAPQQVAEIAGAHGFEITPEDLTSHARARVIGGLQGDLFWTAITGRVLNPGPSSKDPFVQVKGPEWVQTHPYRPAGAPIDAVSPTSLVSLYEECSKAEDGR